MFMKWKIELFRNLMWLDKVQIFEYIQKYGGLDILAFIHTDS